MPFQICKISKFGLQKLFISFIGSFRHLAFFVLFLSILLGIREISLHTTKALTTNPHQYWMKKKSVCILNMWNLGIWTPFIYFSKLILVIFFIWLINKSFIWAFWRKNIKKFTNLALLWFLLTTINSKKKTHKNS